MIGMHLKQMVTYTAKTSHCLIFRKKKEIHVIVTPVICVH